MGHDAELAHDVDILNHLEMKKFGSQNSGDCLGHIPYNFDYSDIPPPYFNQKSTTECLPQNMYRV